MAKNIKDLDQNMITHTPDQNTHWYNTQQWPLEGKAFDDTQAYYDRLPARAEALVREPVWFLSHHTSGLCTRFKTNSKTISAKYTLLNNELAMSHMPATGVSGLDLYARNDQNKWQWAGVARPETAPDVQVEIATDIIPGTREYMLYLPLYNGIKKLEIGVTPQASFEPLAPRAQKPLVCYGTSILQGGCASRPGMSHTAILGRRFDQPVINLGFSGNALMDPEIADLMAEIDAALYVIDALPNMQPELISERTEPFVKTLRKAHPETPIVLVEDRTYAAAPFRPGLKECNQNNRAAFRKAYDNLIADNIQNLTYVSGDQLIGDDYEATVDSSHATDLGFMRMANILEPILRPLL